MDEVTKNFKFDLKDYRRNIDPVKHYMDTTSFILDKLNKTKDSRTDIREYIKTKKRFSNPTVYYRQRDIDGKITKEACGLKNYLDAVTEEGNILVPSGTVYFSTDKKLSLHSEFMQVNTAERSVHKKLAFKYKMEKLWDKFMHHNTIQKTKKIFNNSLSGAYASAGTILNNPSAHYTLTSITRTVSGIGNAVSESLIAGNRHYSSPEVMINHIGAIASSADLKKIEHVVTKYKLNIPDANDTMAYLLKSSSKYWRDTNKELIIYNFLKSLNEYERAAVIYHLDLNAIKEFNEKLMRNIISKFLNYEDKHFSLEESNKIIDEASDLTRNISIYSLSDVLKGKIRSKGDYTTEDSSKLASLILNTNNVLKYLSEIINAFFITDIYPANISRIKDMVRETIVLSDTDSTCASYEDWPDWYFKEPRMDAGAVGVSSFILFITTEVMDHYIKYLGTNFNVEYEKAKLMEMKSEFFWTTFVTTNVSKHYYANVAIQEGNIFDYEDKLKALEKKGVNLISPNAYGPIRALVDEIMMGIMEDVKNKGTIELPYYLKKVVDAEQMLMGKIEQGSPDVLKTEKIKDGKVYKNDVDKSPYLHYLLWNDLFSDRYGKAPDPTYMAVKLPLKIKSKKDMNDFLDSLVDQGFADKYRAFLKKYNKDHIGVLRLPLIKMFEYGIPEVLKGWIDTTRVIKDNCNALYMVLETIGYYIKDGNILSDEYIAY